MASLGLPDYAAPPERLARVVDPSIAPGTGTPSHGGFLYYEVLELLDALCADHEVVGIDLVEVAPEYDHGGTTAILAAQLLLNVIGRVFHRRPHERTG